MVADVAAYSVKLGTYALDLCAPDARLGHDAFTVTFTNHTGGVPMCPPSVLGGVDAVIESCSLPNAGGVSVALGVRIMPRDTDTAYVCGTAHFVL